MRRDVVGRRVGARLGQPTLAETHEDPRKSPCASRIVLMSELAGPAGQEHDDGHDQLRLDQFQKTGFLKSLRITDRFGHHARKAKRKNGIS